MSVHAKLQKARVMLQKTPLKKSGSNKHHGFTYFELADFLPTIQHIFAEVGLMGRTTFEEGDAALIIYDSEQPDSYVIFRSPMAEAQLRGGTPIQQLGAQHTYMRRYLWLMAMEITENDVVDAQPQEEQKPKAEPKSESKPKAAPKPMAGKPGPWQMAISAEVTGGIDNWIATLNEALDLALSMANTQQDVTEIFRVNRAIFDTLKGEDDVAYAEVLNKFKDAKSKMEE